MDERTRRFVTAWLLCCCAGVFAMIALGAYTRLSGSGLSIVQWRPVTGVVPPLDDEAWRRELDAYRASPEYQKVTTGLSLQGFQRIFWVEYAHRLLGRIVGLLMLGPLAVLLIRRRVSRAFGARMGALVGLVAVQGAVGWLMVHSGLVDAPHVSPFRLAAHLLLALGLYAALLWTALDVRARRFDAGAGASAGRADAGAARFIADTRRSGASPRADRRAAEGAWPDDAAYAPSPVRRWLPGVTCALVFVTAAWGALVAGHRAGLAWNTFPRMNGQWIPDGLGALTPAWINPFANAMTVQFVHRALALTTLGAVGGTWAFAPRTQRTPGGGVRGRGANAMAVAVVAQVLLGIATLLLRVPLALAMAHQAGAVLLLTCCLVHAHDVACRARAVAADAQFANELPPHPAAGLLADR